VPAALRLRDRVRAAILERYGEPDLAAEGGQRLNVPAAGPGGSLKSVAGRHEWPEIQEWRAAGKSKSVESQIEDAESRSRRRVALTPEQRQIEQRRQGLELSRRRVQREPRSQPDRPPGGPRWSKALTFLDEEIRKLESP